MVTQKSSLRENVRPYTMKLRRYAKPLAFSKIYSNLIASKFWYFFTVLGVNFVIEEGLSDQNIDVILSTRCEAKCWNKASVEKISCIRNCLNDSWTKPGICPSDQTDATSKLEKTCIYSCNNDTECYGMSKCCRYSCDTTCETPIDLHKTSGLALIPTNVTVSINKSDLDEEIAEVIIEWSTPNNINEREKILYVVEEAHHSGRVFFEDQLSEWSMCQQTSHNRVELQNQIKLGRWYRFRVFSVNENGTAGPSMPTEPSFFTSKQNTLNTPENLKVGATSWGNNQFHLLLTWMKPLSDIPVTKYKIMWSALNNFTLVERHHTLPSVITNFWLHNLEPDIEYFVQVQAQANYGKKKLLGKQACIVFHTPNRTHVKLSSLEYKKDKELKYKRHIKDFLIEKLFWLHNQLLARVTWKPIKKSQTNYYISWSHDGCQTQTGGRYIAKTDVSYLEIYNLEPECYYNISVKMIWHRTLYFAYQRFSTNKCPKKNSSLFDDLNATDLCQLIVTMKRAIFMIFFLSLELIATSEISVPCQSTTRCSCVKFDQKQKYTCNDDAVNYVSVEIIPSIRILFLCYELNIPHNMWLRLLEGTEIEGVFPIVEIHGCPLPQESVKHFFKSIAIEKVKELHLRYIVNGNNVFKDGYFDGLNSTTKLFLQHNEIVHLPNAVFRGLTNLKKLYLNPNKLENLNRELFEPIRKLDTLDLGLNKLTTLPVGVFAYLSNLTLLNLYSNKLIDLRRDIFSDVVKLKSLDLMGNNLKRLNRDIFDDLTYLEDLNLTKNNITSLPDGIFANNKMLKRVRAIQSALSFASFSNLTFLENVQLNLNNFIYLPEDIFYNASSLIIINLRQNSLKSIPSSVFVFNNKLQILDLGFNALTELNGTLFHTLNKLIVLHLENNKLKFINNKVFSMLSSLKELYLQGNDLTYLQSGVFVNLLDLKIINLMNNRLNMSDNLNNDVWLSNLWKCTNIEEIILRNNSVKTIYKDWTWFPNLKILDLNHNLIDKLEVYDLQFSASPVTIDLSNNQITSVNLNNFEFLAASNSHNAQQRSRNVEVLLQNNSIACDCEVYNLARYFQNKMIGQVYDYVKLKPNDLRCQYSNVSKTTLLSSLNLFDLQCQNDNFCPFDCICSFRPVDKTTIIECNPSSLKRIQGNAFHNFSNIELLLSNKNLSSLKDLSSVISQSKVTSLILSHNDLKNIEDLNLPLSLEVLELDSNQLSYLNEKTIEKLNRSSSLKRITLRNNPWQCNCETKYLLNFLQLKHSLVSDLNYIKCQENGNPIIRLSVNDLCKFSLTLIILCISLAVFGIIFGIFTTLYYRYQQEIKVWMFAHKLCLWLVSEKEVDRNKIYDAFISYSHLDEAFVVDHLVPGLENERCRFKLCLHFRDWIVGEWIPDQIIRSVENSRRTIVVLSPNFLNSVWGKIEFRTAHLKAIKERRARVIVILLKDVGPVNKLDPELKTYLTMNTYVKWEDPWFWQKLKYALPHPQQYCKQHPLSVTKELTNVNDNIQVNRLNVNPSLELPEINKKKGKKKKLNILNILNI